MQLRGANPVSRSENMTGKSKLFPSKPQHLGYCCADSYFSRIHSQCCQISFALASGVDLVGYAEVRHIESEPVQLQGR